MPKPITENTLFYGDNLPILHDYVPSESVDLVYLDPPFNSNRSYNVLLKDESGHDADAIENLLKGAQVQMPPTAQTFKQAPKAGQQADDDQMRLGV